ncbi:SigE family RNA polymerase sigma factor [Actinoplanes sp. NEAU-A12]|uniref:SigE family RNA polymerase sigma factor n=1 Tax=Actinoplanes sandaracinus TaxID=3045177 RepID=A0ABT6WTG7_9ACTN|nr:SigE family RNA polymerase sigma factor [Actinoplanes sandaracinus]MDI6103045.1 SigE family RNA polymerase sigma factor [Actinoplanes sandaracinus]
MATHQDFRDFVRGRGLALSRFAFFLTGNDADAEDLVQEALAKTVMRWDRIVVGGQPEAYVRKVMLNHVRRAALRPRVRLTFTATVPDVAPAADEITRTDSRLLLGRALAGLPPRQRAVVYLRYYEDMSEADTARELGCAVGTVKRHAHDALRHLKKSIPTLVAGEALEARS